MKILTLVLILCSAVLFTVPVFIDDAEAGKISGKFLSIDGEPKAEAMVFFFNAETGPQPSPDNYWRIPDKVVMANEQGEFVTELTEGHYYIGVVYKGLWDHNGPPRGKDINFIGMESDGRLKVHLVKDREETEMGVIPEVDIIKNMDVRDELNVTAIEGYVLDENGEPAEKAIVLAYTTAADDSQPLFISDITGKNGQFVLRLQKGGKYFLRARYRDKTRTFGEAAPAPVAVNVETGKSVSGIDVKVK
jgi:hypothetical protein